ncbi:MAG: hypothetical protein NTV62_01690 [Candidatus Gribaldobacteria bacterium]|nr:hypothetical protein [Candidatus Gribaldobacteria bacterium]
MNRFEKKYGIIENKEVKNFHGSRRMFCVKDNVLYIAKPNLSDSHAAWFEKEGWIQNDNDEEFLRDNVRGFIDSDGDVYFYVGYDFCINKKAEEVFFAHLKELAQKMKINPDAKINGGLLKQKPGSKWPPQKFYGRLEDLILDFQK